MSKECRVARLTLNASTGEAFVIDLATLK